MATQPPPPRPFTEAWVRQHFERSEGSRFFVEDMVVLAKQTTEFQDVAEQTLSNQLRQCVESQLQASKSKHSHGVKPHFVGVAEKQAVGAGAGVPVREAATQRSRGQSNGTPGGEGSAQQEGGQQQMLAEPAGAAQAAQAAAAAPSEEEEEGGRGHRAEAGASKRARGDEAGEESEEVAKQRRLGHSNGRQGGEDSAQQEGAQKHTLAAAAEAAEAAEAEVAGEAAAAAAAVEAAKAAEAAAKAAAIQLDELEAANHVDGLKRQITSTVSRPFTCPICYDDVEKGG